MEKETPNKKHVARTYITLRECLTNPEYLRALERIQQAEESAKNIIFYEE